MIPELDLFPQGFRIFFGTLRYRKFSKKSYDIFKIYKEFYTILVFSLRYRKNFKISQNLYDIFKKVL